MLLKTGGLFFSIMLKDRLKQGTGCVFGPVPSRRLGISLGVDIVLAKTCTLDCIYCEAGRTTLHTAQRRKYLDTLEIIGELEQRLATNPPLDYITFSGAGEPTLHSGIGEIIGFLKGKYGKYKICLLTNGTLLGDERLIEDLAPVDLVVPSLDAGDEDTFRKINRPCAGLTCAGLVESIVKFRRRFKNQLWLEIFVVPGINDSEKALHSIRDSAALVMPSKIQLNSLDRPGTEKWVAKADRDILDRFRDVLQSVAPTEIIAKFAAGSTRTQSENISLEAQILDTVSRRPCTYDDLAATLGPAGSTLQCAIDQLLQQKKIFMEKMPRGIFYKTF